LYFYTYLLVLVCIPFVIVYKFRLLTFYEYSQENESDNPYIIKSWIANDDKKEKCRFNIGCRHFKNKNKYKYGQCKFWHKIIESEKESFYVKFRITVLQKILNIEIPTTIQNGLYEKITSPFENDICKQGNLCIAMNDNMEKYIYGKCTNYHPHPDSNEEYYIRAKLDRHSIQNFSGFCINSEIITHCENGIPLILHDKYGKKITISSGRQCTKKGL